MGAEQVLLRSVRAVVAVCIALAPSAALAGDAESVIIVDLRPGAPDDRRDSREAFAAELAGVQGIELVDDPELTAALAGDFSDDVGPRAKAAIERAGTAYGSLDCPAAIAASTEAVALHAELQARGAAVTAELTQAYVYALLCHHSAGDAEKAAAAANRLHRLGVDAAPTGVSAAIWQTYPALDARANVAVVELTVQSDPPGAHVWVDHVDAGPSPATVLVSEGQHIVAIATADGSAGSVVSVSGTSATAELAVAATATRWKAVADMVGSWRRGENAATAVELGELLAITGVRLAVVLSGTRQVEIWGLRGDAEFARRHGAGVITDAFAIGVELTERIAQWEGRSPDPNLPLLVEDPNEAVPEPKKPHRWWVYATIIGSVVVGGLIVMSNDLADDHQKIELTWP